MLELNVFTHKPHTVQELSVNKNKVGSFINLQCNSVGHLLS